MQDSKELTYLQIEPWQINPMKISYWKRKLLDARIMNSLS